MALIAASLCATAAAVLVVVGAFDLVPRALPSVAPGRAVLALAGRVGSAFGMQRVAVPATLAVRIVAAGSPGGLRPRDWTTLKCATAGIALCGAMLTAGSFPGRLGLPALVAAPAAGFVLPDYWLARVGRRRAEAALYELPHMLDLLRVTVAAGRSTIAAMGLVASRFDGPLAAEWRAAAAQVALGVPQSAALEQIGRRVPVAGVGTLVETLGYSHRAGLSLADALMAQATAARHARRQQIREQAARAAPKMQLVVAVVLVPSVMLTLGAVLTAELSATGLGLEY